ncbi:hypothetical protein [Amycolatopsis albispora]|uniref:Uncharacterized protein n=1 Tax=Amycolatopsis albispora TaxID=1804986 RepID=A0A344LA78_9PSEU|nr:hypothetical protein [Amycolatopsis albispora]AXB44952.1 hypothetical protein A4R43_22670 [Amycolatopsis albispora]
MSANRLGQAAAMMEDAAETGRFAAGVIELGREEPDPLTGGPPFGISAQARRLAETWNAALRTRAAEMRALAELTEREADEVRDAADGRVLRYA